MRPAKDGDGHGLLRAEGKWAELQAMMEMKKMAEGLEAAATELDELANAIEEGAERRMENEN